MREFKVGDIILYVGNSWGNHPDEVGRNQKVIGIHNGDYITEFMDTGYRNRFGMRSNYYEYCVVDRDAIGWVNSNKYGNGIPLLWEDEV